MNSTEILISIIIPTYNRKDAVIKLIGSLSNQKNKNFEVIVIDDGSSDGTYKVLKKSILNIIYQDTLFMINKVVIALILLFLIYKISFYIFEGRAQKFSYFHLFSHICTLEILPWVAIIAFIL